MRTSSKLKSALAFSGLVVCIGLVVAIVFEKKRSREPVYLKLYSIVDTKNLRGFFSFYIDLTGKLPAPEALQNGIYNTKMLYSAVASDTNNVWFHISRNAQWKEAKDIVDLYGNPYRISVDQFPGKPQCLRINIVGLGPNGKFDEGKGDDVVEYEDILKQDDKYKALQ